MRTKFVPTLLSLTLLAGIVCPSFSHFLDASMSSTNYRIDWDTISNGGLDSSSSASYILRDTIGNPAIGPSTSASYSLRAGYRQGVDDQVLTFLLLPQESATQTAASAFASDVVTVASSADFSVGDYALIVQDEGEGQVSGFGEITATTATTITFDDVADNGTAPTIDGTNDVVYLLTPGTLTFGELSADELITRVIGWEVTAAFDNGYSVQVSEDGNLRSGAVDIDDVADGAVTSGSEEYGGRSSDTTLTSSSFDSEDAAITTSAQAVATTSSFSFADRHHLTLKAAISSSTTAGSYSQTLTFVVTGNY